MLNEITISAIVSFIVTVIYNRIFIAHVFKTIDNYVKELFDITKESIRNAYIDKRSS